MILEQFDIKLFLAEYWQRKPCLIKKAIDLSDEPVSPDELAGLACEEEVESRLVRCDDTGKKWHLTHGPFSEETFLQLPPANWTLLVQAVDIWHPPVKNLKRHFRFIPDWRIDDVMVSYATDHGGVGPHFDYYDVFLLQGCGRRRWFTGGLCEADAALMEDCELRILEKFVPEQEFMVESGDMLYLPPRFAHQSISEGASVCYSIGFRAPSAVEMLQGISDELSCRSGDEERYRDGEPGIPEHPGEIRRQVIADLHQWLLQKVNDTDAIARWFGSFVTSPRYENLRFPQPTSKTGLKAGVSGGKGLARDSHARLAFLRQESETHLFADGHRYRMTNELMPLASRLCDAQFIEAAFLAPWLKNNEALDLLLALVNSGSLVLTDIATDSEE